MTEKHGFFFLNTVCSCRAACEICSWSYCSTLIFSCCISCHGFELNVCFLFYLKSWLVSLVLRYPVFISVLWAGFEIVLLVVLVFIPCVCFFFFGSLLCFLEPCLQFWLLISCLLPLRFICLFALPSLFFWPPSASPPRESFEFCVIKSSELHLLGLLVTHLGSILHVVCFPAFTVVTLALKTYWNLRLTTLNWNPSITDDCLICGDRM